MGTYRSGISKWKLATIVITYELQRHRDQKRNKKRLSSRRSTFTISMEPSNWRTTIYTKKTQTSPSIRRWPLCNDHRNLPPNHIQKNEHYPERNYKMVRRKWTQNQHSKNICPSLDKNKRQKHLPNTHIIRQYQSRAIGLYKISGNNIQQQT